MTYDVFISYRRDGGEHTAKILHDSLTGMGYRVFFDVESLRSGEFNRALFDVIEHCADFLVVLSPGALDRCEREDDWVRLEVACALKNGKNVVPVLLRGFSFPAVLPGGIDGLRWKNGIEASTEFFDAFLRKLVSFLDTKPPIQRRIAQNYVFRRVLPLCAALMVVLGLAAGGYGLYRSAAGVYPRTTAERNLVSESVYYASTNLSRLDRAMSVYDRTLSTCRSWLAGEPGVRESDVSRDLARAREQTASCRDKLLVLDAALSDRLTESPLPKDDFTGQLTFLQTSLDSMEETLNFLEDYLADGMVLPATKLRYVDLLREISDLEKDVQFYCLNDMFLEVGDVALKELKTEILPNLTCIYTGQPWLTGEDDVEGIIKGRLAAWSDKLTQAAALVGEEQRINDRLETGLNAIRTQADALAVLEDRAREKYAPQEGDGADALWKKLLIFHTLGMDGDAVDCLERFAAREDRPDGAEVFVPAARAFFDQMDRTGYAYGCLVGGFEYEDQPHDTVRLGDILVALNGQPTPSATAFRRAQETYEDEDWTLTLLRLDGGGNLRQEEAALARGQTRLLLYSLAMDPEEP